MEIHIRHAVEFEKVKDWKDAISLTRKRMSIQQLLDSRDSDTMLVNQLTQYIAAFEQALALVVRERHLPLQSIPLFAWNINGETFNSACWKTDAVLARLALAECLLTVGTTQLPNYKLASTTFATSIKQHQEIIQHLGTWNWKYLEQNYFFLQPEWHTASICHLECLRHLAMVAVGIEKQLPNSTLYTVAQRAVTSATRSIAAWPDARQNILPLCETLRYYFSSNVLWEQEQYGASIYTMQQWLSNKTDTSAFDSIDTELDKIDFLLAERQRLNNGAYFDTVAEQLPLPSPIELLSS